MINSQRVYIPIKKKSLIKRLYQIPSIRFLTYNFFNLITCMWMYHELKTPLMNIFSHSLSTGIFPDKMKITKVSPIFKTGKKSIASNYRPISALPCFSNILERIMYNRLYSYLTENNILFNKKFGFWGTHSTEHALLELVDQIKNTFNGKNYLLGLFIDLSKAFDTVEHYEINRKNLS